MIKKTYILNSRKTFTPVPAIEKEKKKRLAAEEKMGHKMTDSEYFEYKKRFIK
jgi:hypothetical protein